MKTTEAQLESARGRGQSSRFHISHSLETVSEGLSLQMVGGFIRRVNQQRLIVRTFGPEFFGDQVPWALPPGWYEAGPWS